MVKGRSVLMGLVVLLALAGCENKKQKVVKLREQCHEICKKQQGAHELCLAFCKQEKIENCDELYCATPLERYQECDKCCDEKGSEEEFLLGSCLSQGDLSELMTAEKKWDIWKKMVDDRVAKEKKAAEEAEAAEHLAAAAKSGWHVSFEESGDGKVVGVVLVKKALTTPAGGKEGVLPDLIFRCAGGALEAYVHVAAEIGGGGKPKIKLFYDGKSTSEKMKKSESNDTLIFGSPDKSLAKMLKAKKLDVEFPTGDGGTAAVTFELEGLEKTLEPHAEACGF